MVSRKLPFLSRTQIRICEKANKDHKKTWRLFAHTGHFSNTICVAEAMEEEAVDPSANLSSEAPVSVVTTPFPISTGARIRPQREQPEGLFDEEVLGILVHEFGHLAATALQLEHHRSAPTDADETPDDLQMEADLIMVKKLDLRSYTYNDRDIQWIDIDEFETREIGHGF